MGRRVMHATGATGCTVDDISVCEVDMEVVGWIPLYADINRSENM